MKPKLLELSQQYATALRRHLKHTSGTDLGSALKLGRRAVALKLETLDLARAHEKALSAIKSKDPGGIAAGRAELFFTEAITPIVETHRAARRNKQDLETLKAMLRKRTAELAKANLQLQKGIIRRQQVESALKESSAHYTRLLKESFHLQDGLRQLAHQVLETQEDQRNEVSHELQDQIAQTLLGINVRLLSLKQEAKLNAKGLKNEIASTQRLVSQSARSVRKVARKFGNL